MEKGAARAKRGGIAGDADSSAAKPGICAGRSTPSGTRALAVTAAACSGRTADSPRRSISAVILGVLHAGLGKGPHSVQDERVLLTFKKLNELFAAEYAINSGGGQGIMFGRYKGDSYVSGGAYYFSTFGAAEFYYRLAQADPVTGTP